jgi:arginase family enzyme
MELPGMEWFKPSLRTVRSCSRMTPQERLVYIGLRDLDAGEKEIIRRYSIKVFCEVMPLTL